MMLSMQQAQRLLHVLLYIIMLSISSVGVCGCRAFDGDEVAVEILPLPYWYKIMRLMPQALADKWVARPACGVHDQEHNIHCGVLAGLHAMHIITMEY